MKSKNILLISSEFPPGPGGIGQHAKCFAEALASKGFRVWVATDADYADRADVEVFDRRLPAGVQVYRTFRSGIKTYFRRVFTIKKILRNCDIDTIFLSGKFPLWIGLLLKLAGVRKPIVAVLHGSEVNLRNPAVRWLTHRAIASVDHLVPVSAFTESLLPSGIRRKANITIIPNGITPSDFFSEDGKTNELSGDPVLLTVGNVTRRKGQHRVIKAMPEILNKFPQACYHIIGLPTLRDEFQKIAIDLGVTERVVFHGRLSSREALFHAYQAADVFCILSENQPDGDVEGFGIVVLEANMFGLPAIGAEGCGISDAIENGTNGFLVNGDAPEDVSGVLSEILNHREKLAASSLEWAKRHDWDQIVKRFLKVMEEAR